MSTILTAAAHAVCGGFGEIPDSAIYTRARRSHALVAALFEDCIHERYGKAEWLRVLEKMARE